MRSLAPLAFAAISGIILWKLLATLLLPLVALLVGLAGTAIKLALIGGVIVVVYSMVKRRRQEAEA